MLDEDEDPGMVAVEESDYAASDGGSFTQYQSIFEPRTFTDKESVFSTPRSKPVDQRNPLTTRAAENEKYQMPSDVKKGRRQLVANFGDDGMPVVATFEDQTQLERWRSPTQAELAFLSARGRFTRGGIGSVDEDPQPSEKKPASLGKTLIGVALLGAVGYGGWKAYCWMKADRDVKTVRA